MLENFYCGEQTTHGLFGQHGDKTVAITVYVFQQALDNFLFFFNFIGSMSHSYKPSRLGTWHRRYFYLPPVFEKRQEVLFWGPSLYPPSLRMFRLISRLLLKLAFLNLACAIYAKNNIDKMFLDLKKDLNCSFDRGFFKFLVKNLLRAESQKPLGGVSQNLHCRYI